MVETTNAAEDYVVVLPARPRRLLLAAAACAAGAALVYAFPATVAPRPASVVILGVSFLAGLSTLWSP